ncbi:zinc-alpha-2-glycoprotein-like [Notechis scutatus]|uniref:Zinc-alpha-2-glycoprotein-like n=1 Tax=Notechis scutatus TaxID=8663 RepID=A0A6J1W307_9SAUR|nr:zinc-alpha-2-glycoprotein-like [Notechis scutatus]
MGLPRAILGLLAAAAVLLLREGCAGSPSHSLHYYYLEVPEPSQGLPRFVIRGYLDDQPITQYDSLTGTVEPLVSWMEEAEKKTYLALDLVISPDLMKLSELNHPTEGLHIWQVILGCDDRNKGGVFRYGYNGSDFISFENETWVTAQPQAEKVKEKWVGDPDWSQISKDYLEKICIEWLKKYLSYRKKALESTENPRNSSGVAVSAEPPVGKVIHKEVNDSLEVFICQAVGFYPKEIQATWTRDGEACQDETLHRNVAPNSDGTYYLWLSIKINPKERDRFRCHLEHEGLQEPLDLAFKEERATGWQIPVGIVVTVVLALGILFLICWCWRRMTTVCQKTKSSPDNSLLEVHSSSPTSGREENERLLQSSPQSKITLDDRTSYGWWNPQRAVGDSVSTLHRREGKQPPRRRSSLESLDKAGATVRIDGARVAKIGGKIKSFSA